MPTNCDFLGIGCPSLYSQFAQLGSEIVDSLWPTFEIFPFFGDASQRPGAISTAWCGTQSTFSKETALTKPRRFRLRQQPLPGRASCFVTATEIVRTKCNARAWQWFSTFSLKAFLNRVNHLMLVPNGEVLSLGK